MLIIITSPPSILAVFSNDRTYLVAEGTRVWKRITKHLCCCKLPKMQYGQRNSDGGSESRSGSGLKQSRYLSCCITGGPTDPSCTACAQELRRLCQISILREGSGICHLSLKPGPPIPHRRSRSEFGGKDEGLANLSDI